MMRSPQQNGSDDGISPLELESLASSGSSPRSKGGGLKRLAAAHLPSNLSVDKLLLLVKLYFELYPKFMISSSTLLVGFLLVSWAPWQGWGQAKNSTRNHMTHDYTALTDNFNFQTAQIDHWCLFGGDDRCYCEDPTEPVSRSEVQGWSRAHNRNKHLATQAVGKGKVDVVFFGDQNIQSWDGRWLDRPAPEGNKISRLYNKTFVAADADFQGLALGVFGDRINNILWRIQHGELPASLNPKVFWLVMGTNDLALGMCSEEVVTLGIMRIAEEVHHLFPDSIIVVQGILPRSNHKDGSLEGGKTDQSPRTKFMSRSKSTGRDVPAKYRERVNGGGANINQYMPMNPGGTRKLAEGGEHKEMDQILMEELDDMEENTHRNLQDLTTPGLATTPSTKKTAAKAAEPEARTVSAGSASSPRTAVIGGPPAGTTVKWDFKGKNLSKEKQRPPQPIHDYYLWPSIQAINKELEGFCSKHEHFVYFDADNLVLGSIGNAHYHAAHKTIITELMPNYVHLSHIGHKVVMGAVGEELKRIIYDDDERNNIEEKQ